MGQTASVPSLTLVNNFFFAGSNPVLEELVFPSLETAGMGGDAGVSFEGSILKRAIFTSLKTIKGEFVLSNRKKICISFPSLDHSPLEELPVRCTLNATCACKLDGCQVKNCPFGAVLV